VKSRLTSIERFFAKVEPEPNSGCWLWIGCTTKPGPHGGGGYGQFWDGVGYVYAHRYSYRLAFGNLEESELVRHSCDNPPCVNPAHLLKGTDQDNTQDAVERGRLNPQRGERHWKATLSDLEVEEIRNLRAQGSSLVELSCRFSVAESTISRYCNHIRRAS